MARFTVASVCSLLLVVGCLQTAVSANRPRKTSYTKKSSVMIDTQDTASIQGAALKKHIGKRVSFSGKLMPRSTGNLGLYDEKTKTDVHFETLPVPQNRELTLYYTVIRDRKNPDAITISVNNVGGEWYSEESAPDRNLKLRNLLKSLNPNDVFTATGTLCHLKVISTGDYKLFPIPSSHFFFSVDDLSITRDEKSID